MVLFHRPAGLEPTASDTGFTTGSAIRAAIEAATEPPAASTTDSTDSTDITDTTKAALRLCRRALHTAPSLAGWSVTPLGPTEMIAWVVM